MCYGLNKETLGLTACKTEPLVSSMLNKVEGLIQMHVSEGGSLIPALLSSDVLKGCAKVEVTGCVEVEATALRFRPLVVLFGSGGIPATLSEISGSSLLEDKMKVVFSQAQECDEGFIEALKELSSAF
ncbi:hypothetical protein Tco_1542803, partial [Tanacetum coccineum]